MRLHLALTVVLAALLIHAYLPARVRRLVSPAGPSPWETARAGHRAAVREYAGEKLAQHTLEWASPEGPVAPYVMEVREGVYVAIGFGVANSILLLSPRAHTPPQYVIIDALESRKTAALVQAAFAPYTRGRELAAIIYTHNHQDHCYGADVFVGERPLARRCAVEGVSYSEYRARWASDGAADEGGPPASARQERLDGAWDARGVCGAASGVQIWSHATTLEFLNRAMSRTAYVEFRRGVRQFGALLPPTQRENVGIGPFMDIDEHTIPGVVRPTHTFSGDAVALDVAGMRLELHHAPGETDDQVVVWDGARRILFAADNVYRAFPNLYAIRGTPARDVLGWSNSIEKMRAFGAEVMVPSHTRPVHGAEAVNALLLAYSDAIRYVHDQTLRLLNRGLTTGEIVEAVALPPALRDHPFLEEYYGTVEWSVRGVVQFYVGWFGGDPVDLLPLSLAERGARLMDAVGGAQRMAELIEAARRTGDHQWMLELATHARHAQPDEPSWRALAVAAMRGLAGEQVSANARNYLLTFAHEAESGINGVPPTQEQMQAIVEKLEVWELFEGLCATLDPVRAGTERIGVLWHMRDAEECHVIRIRNGVARAYFFSGARCAQEVVESDAPADAACGRGPVDVVAHTTTEVFRALAAKRRNTALALAAGDISVEGGVWSLASIMGMFRQPFDE